MIMMKGNISFILQISLCLEMVLISMIRQTAAKRIPLIKFRRQREEEMAAARSGSVLSGGQKGKSASSPAAVSLMVHTQNVCMHGNPLD